MECRCTVVDTLWGAEAEAYVGEHLRSDADGSLVCPDTGALWELDEHANEQVALRRTGTAGAAPR